ncbi:MAG: hypothetical protein M3401_03570, partial [Actinomycetota bacterium]|nr:hypothetical protein [Actinomycetota bacterium]
MSAPIDNRCPLCAGPSASAFITRDRNRGIGDEEFEYRRCRECGVLYLRNVPDDLARFYPSEYFSLPALEELRTIGRGSERHRIELVRRYARGGRVAEIGPGDGIFALQALDAGFDVVAIE